VGNSPKKNGEKGSWGGELEGGVGLGNEGRRTRVREVPGGKRHHGESFGNQQKKKGTISRKELKTLSFAKEDGKGGSGKR